MKMGRNGSQKLAYIYIYIYIYMGNSGAPSIKGYIKVVSFLCLKIINEATYTLITLIK